MYSMYVTFFLKTNYILVVSAHALRGVSSVASFITIDEQFQ